MTLEDPTRSTQSSMHGSGNESCFVVALTLRLSLQNCEVWSALGMRREGELQGLLLGTAKPWSRRYFTSCCITACLVGWTWYESFLIGLWFPISMSCFNILVWVDMSPKRLGKLLMSALMSDLAESDRCAKYAFRSDNISEFLRPTHKQSCVCHPAHHH